MRQGRRWLAGPLRCRSCCTALCRPSAWLAARPSPEQGAREARSLSDRKHTTAGTGVETSNTNMHASITWQAAHRREYHAPRGGGAVHEAAGVALDVGLEDHLVGEERVDRKRLGGMLGGSEAVVGRGGAAEEGQQPEEGC